jgi:hypothetical protein
MTRPTKAIARAKNAPSKALATIAPAQLLNDLRALIGDSRQRVAQVLNAALVLLYWQVGQRIRTDILKEKRADYGKEIVHALCGQLAIEFGTDLEGRTSSTWCVSPRFFQTSKLCTH